MTSSETAKVNKWLNAMPLAPPSTPATTQVKPTALANRPQQNLSFVLEGIHKVKFEDRPIPALKNSHDVLINVKYTGICGSDVCNTKYRHAPPSMLRNQRTRGDESSAM